ncbi:hypothetical protein BGZ63DRAFT_416631 [Mariannaea sp. PMI_226]|nr:hypothetical protein BGZ63DRAFT_416631 [Mariannaea sp. PMI_226]
MMALPTSPTESVSGPLPLTDSCLFLTLPAELILSILNRLSPSDLAAVSATCQLLRSYAIIDETWKSFVQENVPGVELTSPGPCASFRELYAAHDRLWFLPKQKIWFCDGDMTGKLIITRFDHRRGCIEAYRLVAWRGTSTVQTWTTHGMDITVSDFEPRLSLHLDKPILQFRVQPLEDNSSVTERFLKRPEANRFSDEMPMQLDDRLENMFSNFILARAMRPEAVSAHIESAFPYNGVWPPPALPATERVCKDASIRPRRRSQVSDQAFFLRHWMQMTGTHRPRVAFTVADEYMRLPQAMTTLFVDNYSASVNGRSYRAHLGEGVTAFATLDPAWYTPTDLKPWRGIWVGDYNDHGCEFILIHQPDDDAPASDAELGIERRSRESDEDWEARRAAARIYRGRMEGIKLTGDPNVPRGERTFVVEDLGGNNVEYAVGPPFTGVRMVNSQGHIAGMSFYDDTWVDSQLLLISHDRLAQYWIGFGRVNYYQRVDIDQFIRP